MIYSWSCTFAKVLPSHSQINPERRKSIHSFASRFGQFFNYQFQFFHRVFKCLTFSWPDIMTAVLLIDLFNYASAPTSGNSICFSIRVDSHLTVSWFSFITGLKSHLSEPVPPVGDTKVTQFLHRFMCEIVDVRHQETRPQRRRGSAPGCWSGSRVLAPHNWDYFESASVETKMVLVVSGA